MWRAWSWGDIYIDFDIISTNYTARLQADMLTLLAETIVGVCWLCIQCIPALKYKYSHSYFGKAAWLHEVKGPHHVFKNILCFGFFHYIR